MRLLLGLTAWPLHWALDNRGIGAMIWRYALVAYTPLAAGIADGRDGAIVAASMWPVLIVVLMMNRMHWLR